MNLEERIEDIIKDNEGFHMTVKRLEIVAKENAKKLALGFGEWLAEFTTDNNLNAGVLLAKKGHLYWHNPKQEYKHDNENWELKPIEELFSIYSETLKTK